MSGYGARHLTRLANPETDSPQRRKGPKVKALVNIIVISRRRGSIINQRHVFMDSRLVIPGLLPSHETCMSCTSRGNEINIRSARAGLLCLLYQ